MKQNGLRLEFLRTYLSYIWEMYGKAIKELRYYWQRNENNDKTRRAYLPCHL